MDLFIYKIALLDTLHLDDILANDLIDICITENRLIKYLREKLNNDLVSIIIRKVEDYYFDWEIYAFLYNDPYNYDYEWDKTDVYYVMFEEDYTYNN